MRGYTAQFLVVLILLVLSFGYAYARQTTLNFHPTFDFAVFDPTYADSVVVRLLTFTQAFSRYVALFFAPINLHMDHSLPVLTSAISIWPWLSVVLLGSGFLLGWLEFHYRRQVWIWFGWLWFLSGLVPISGVIPVNGLFYEHWLYLPMVGLLIIVAQLIRYLLRKYSLSFLNWLPAFVLLICLVLTIRQNYLWGNHIRFYEYTLQFTQSARLFNNLGMAYAEEGQLEKAVVNYNQALDISNGYPQIYYNLGNVLLAQGNSEEALTNFLLAIELDPAFAYAYVPALQIAQQLEKEEIVAALLEQAEALSPDFAQQLRSRYVQTK
jgi:hypothetical protein